MIAFEKEVITGIINLIKNAKTAALKKKIFAIIILDNEINHRERGAISAGKKKTGL
jgi:hypothetical protein